MSNLILRLCKAAKDTDGPLGDLLLEAAESITLRGACNIRVDKSELTGLTVIVGDVAVPGARSVILAAELLVEIEQRHDSAMREIMALRLKLAERDDMLANAFATAATARAPIQPLNPGEGVPQRRVTTVDEKAIENLRLAVERLDAGVLRASSEAELLDSAMAVHAAARKLLRATP